MVRWHRPARLAVGALGIGCAAAVYLGLGERPTSAPPPPIQRLHPNALLEMSPGVLGQWRGAEEDFEVRYATMAVFEDGTTAITGVRITTVAGDGREFVVSAASGSTRDHRVFEVDGDVRLRASDGFELFTESGSFSRDDAVFRAAGPVRFGKGRMAGSGRGMTYDRNTDVLRLAHEADLSIAAGEGGAGTRLTAGAATFDRVQERLTAEGDVDVADAGQAMRADRVLAQLTPGGGGIAFAELRGHASVEAAPAVDAMQARAIDLTYAGDGRALERAVLTGDAVVALREGGTLRQFSAESFQLALAEDGSIERVTGRTGVRMRLPAAGAAPERRIDAAAFDGTGSGGALSALRFDGDVVFREEADAGARVARSPALALELAADGTVAGAVFTGGATFEDGSLVARAADARYEPGRGLLALEGMDARGEPSVADEQVVIDARSIGIDLERRRIDAEGRVKTTLLPGAARARPRESGAPARHPGLLAPDQAARVTAGALAYDSVAGTARYSGGARLWQKETDLRAETIEVDFSSGDLTARGDAQALLAFDTGRSEGQAHEIAYRDTSRVITYAAAPADAGRDGAPRARVTGPQGDLRGERITVFLADAGSGVTRLESAGRVEVLVDGRRVTGAHLTYHAAEERYVVTGSATAPVRVRVTDPCREMVGRTLIYSRTTDTMHMDGSDVTRTMTTRGDSCQA